ncbi:MAG: saccharopine dehydrogenase NADP-binding domain-containing protein, partial [Treponema sp.]|nr:saccharopine dehydrogenase NADP-binding domain-containing protein [Treponema sp.]
MKDKILIIGGYGQVGKYVTLELVNSFQKKVIVAGRNIKKANDFAQENDNLFETLRLDIYDTESFSASIINVKIAIMCLSPNNNDFAKYCLENGIHYVDISPSNDVAKNIEQFRAEAEINHSTCVLGVGLSPGLSNLLVKKLKQNEVLLKKVNINLMLGLGEAHGQDGIKWLLDNIKNDFIVNNIKIKPFGKNKKVIFIEPLGKRSVYPFNLADQYIVSKTQNIKDVLSYFCYDSK